MRLKAYTGRTLEELAPQIREELGASAVILSQRETVRGGVGGFFGTKQIEVLAADRMPDEHDLAEAQATVEPELRDALAAAAVPALEQPVRPGRHDEIATGLRASAEAGSLDVTDGGADVADLVAAALAEAVAVPERQAMRQQEAAAATPNLAQAYSEPLQVRTTMPQDGGLRLTVAPGEDELELDESEVAAPVVEAPAAPRRRPARAAAPAPAPAVQPIEDGSAEAELLAELDQGGMSAELARAIVSEVELHGRPFAAATPLRDLVRDRIAAEVHTASGWTPAAEPHRMVAIGPSGSGKTSSLVKLADAYTQAGLAVAVVSIEGPSSAGSLGTRLAEDIDGGADFDVRRVATVAAARAARKALAHHDLVLVDTPGACATDDAVLAHAQKLLKALGTAETHLVLPVSLAGREAGAAIARFDWADRLLVTKLDETRFPGALLSLAQHGELPLSYLGTGAGLQGGIQVANGRLIAERILPI